MVEPTREELSKMKTVGDIAAWAKLPTDSQTPISVVSEGRHEGEYRDTTPLLQYLWTINDSAKMSSEISCR